MNLPNLWEILVLTRRSETRKKALPRYKATGVFISKFYHFEPWTPEGQKALKEVNHYHLQAALHQRLLTRAERKAKAKEILANLPEEEKIPKHPLDVVLSENIELLKVTRFKDTQFDVYEEYVNSE